MGKRREHYAKRLVASWYAQRPIGLLRPLSSLFRAMVWLRRSLYRVGVFRIEHIPARVVVVGNITVGGSGKTPLVAWLARELTHSGKKVGIVTRGYGGKHDAVCEVDINASANDVGDEPLWLARETRVPVVVGRDRVAAARHLVERHHPDIVICDDGLQHYRLARDVQIVAVDARRGFGNGSLLPAGPLRERPSRLEQVHAIVLKGQGEALLPEAVPVFKMRLALSRAVSLSDGKAIPLTNFHGKRVHAVAAIADPEGFFVALEQAGLDIERHPLPDHAPIDETLAQLGSEQPILMTDKDAARLAQQPANAWRVPLAIGFADEDAARLLELARGAASNPEEN